MVRKKQKDNYYIIRLLCSISSNTNDSSLMRLFLSIFLFSSLLNSQINPNNIDIVRDNYGVPHIFAKTDAELAYGLAWANACLLYTSPSPRDKRQSRMPSSA